MLRRGLSVLLTAAFGVVVVVAGSNSMTAEPNRGKASTPAERLDLDGDPLPPDALTRLGTSRFWCAERCSEVTYSQDGGKIVAMSHLGACVFDAASGKRLRHIMPAQGAVRSMSSTPDGRYLALGLENRDNHDANAIQIWDLATGRLWRECQIKKTWVPGLLFSPDGTMLAAYSGSDQTIYLWDPATGKQIRSWTVSAAWDNLIGLTFSADAKTLIVGDERTIRFWDTATGKEVRRIANHPGRRVCKLVLSRDGKILASQAHTGDMTIGGSWARDKKVYLWDTATGKMIRQIEVVEEKGKRDRFGYPLAIYDFEFSPDTKFLTTASDDGVLSVWDVATGKELHHWDTGDWVHAIAFAPDGKTLASLGSGHTVRLWDTATGKEREHPSQRQRFGVLDLTPDGHTLAAAGIDRDVRLWDTTTGKQLNPLIAGAGNVSALRFAADGRALTALGDDGKSRTWDVATGKEMRQIPLPFKEKASMHVLSPDGKTWASVMGDGVANVVLWEATTGKKRHVLVGEYWLTVLGFAPDGGTIHCWQGHNWVRSWDVATSKELRGFAAGEGQSETGSFSPDGNWFACLGHLRLLLLYDMATGEVVHRIQVQGNCDYTADYQPGYAYSPNGRTLAVADTEGTIHLLELASGKFRRRLAAGHQGSIRAMLFSADGRRLISGSADMTALVWDLTGRLSATTKPLSAAELDAGWTDLAGQDAETADRAIRRLAAAPADALPYLATKLQPAIRADPKRVDELIRDLDSDRFAERERASRELEKLGETATALCRKALADDLTAEARQRIEAFLKKQEQERLTPSPQRLRIVRALEALEFAGTPEARQLLEKLAGGVAEAIITREAKASLRPLKRQTGIQPAP